MDYLNVARCFAILHRRSQNFLVEACQKLGLTYSEYVLLKLRTSQTSLQ